MMLDIGKRYGLSAVRLPREPSFPGGASLGYRVGIAPWLRHLERRLNRAGMAHNDHLVGLTATGQMNEAELLRTITALPTGISEIYLYPATRNHLSASMADYDHRGELYALLSSRVRELLDSRGVHRISYRDLTFEHHRVSETYRLPHEIKR